MINKLIIKDIACFNKNGIVIDNLSKINYIYGENASGKTTISNIIQANESNSDSQLQWIDSNRLKTLVYNKNFIDQNISDDDKIKGIFTLGEESIEAQKQIRELKEKGDSVSGKLINLKNLKSSTEKELLDIEDEFENHCWLLKQKYDEYFSDAFSGYRNSKSNFKDKIKKEYSRKIEVELKQFEDLEKKANSIFGNSSEKAQDIDDIIYENFLKYEIDNILKVKIIGKEDVDIAAIIKKLNNSDWIKQGRKYHDINNNICPYCQQPTSPELKQQLDEYFSDIYTEQIEQVNRLETNYLQSSKYILNQLEELIKAENEFIEIDTISVQKNILEEKFKQNKILFNKKKLEPSTDISLESTKNIFENIEKFIGKAKNKIKEHNLLIDNLDIEKKALIKHIWRFVISEIDLSYKQYETKRKKINKTLENIETQRTELDDEKSELDENIAVKESQSTSIEHTINEINNTLSSFGFTNFKLEHSEKKGFYKLKRSNGEDALKTLSEGEKSFISFLYFYQLLKGSLDKKISTSNKVVVFDDPVSSLDCNVLFIVSCLIRDLFENIDKNNGDIKQIFILTHNIYFHKEVSFKRNKQRNNSFWIIRKENDSSTITQYEKNPIKTSYELLWHEINTPGEKNHVTIRNTLRRILENYFKILGKMNDNDIIDQFKGKEKIICQALISWINDGSHSVNDDLYVDLEQQNVSKYLKVFKDIFDRAGHIEHYNMMMKSNEYAEADDKTLPPRIESI